MGRSSPGFPAGASPYGHRCRCGSAARGSGPTSSSRSRTAATRRVEQLLQRLQRLLKRSRLELVGPMAFGRPRSSLASAHRGHRTPLLVDPRHRVTPPFSQPGIVVRKILPSEFLLSTTGPFTQYSTLPMSMPAGSRWIRGSAARFLLFFPITILGPEWLSSDSSLRESFLGSLFNEYSRSQTRTRIGASAPLPMRDVAAGRSFVSDLPLRLGVLAFHLRSSVVSAHRARSRINRVISHHPPDQLSQSTVSRRVLFDTNLANLTLDHGDFIFDGGNGRGRHALHTLRDLNALRVPFALGSRGGWELAVSSIASAEIIRTPNSDWRENIPRWFSELGAYWRQILHAADLSDTHAGSLTRRLINSDFMQELPDKSDRILGLHAIAYSCNTFGIRHSKAVLRHRNHLTVLGLQFHSAAEWFGSL